ncbi:MAG: anaerobic ribonucleoside-triphosphate reductase activating protein [Sphaerochaetaceae bacterium]|nr:anaerobic ribonucleoside-triphosphate reductase activating protein [Spirochaetales bacterium]MDY5498637.1 anaerobic ribonucleoside-triphosphate reductase activating protein [Sphaerochaetaceae bacterium]
MRFGGFEKLDLVNFPGLLAATVFVEGCNFRCPYCHNATLVERHGDKIEEEEVFAYLAKRKRMLKGVVVTGGEPTIHKEIPDFVAKVRDMGFKVKLDTNGNNPAMLKQLLEGGMLDYVAMDIKTSVQNYPLVTGVDAANVSKSVEILKHCAVPYEFRTTCVKGLIQPSDFLLIGKWIEGARRYVLQPFNPEHTLDPAFHSYSTYSDEELKLIAQRMREFVSDVLVR